MPTRTLVLTLVLASVLVGCSDMPLGPTPDTMEPALSVIVPEIGPPGDRVVARVRGGAAVTQHSWAIFKKIEFTNLDAWVDRDGNAGGSYDFYLEFSWGASIQTHEEVVCLSVDPATRQAWLVGVRYRGGQPHYSIAQMREYAPEDKGETGKESSGRVDMFTGRSMMSTEGPDFCQQQPDLASIPVDEFGQPPAELFPVDSGDLRIQLSGPR